MPNFIKIRPEGAELFHADRRTDMTKPIIAFRKFGKALKTVYKHIIIQHYINVAEGGFGTCT